MRFEPNVDDDGIIRGYLLRMSENDTRRWAERWPTGDNSTLAGRRIGVVVDGNGLRQVLPPPRPGTREIDAEELRQAVLWAFTEMRNNPAVEECTSFWPVLRARPATAIVWKGRP